jgi:membrane-associated protease RseP (regulator of RpoE activity)
VHHTQHDLFETAIPEYQRHSAVVVALGALGLANEAELLDRRNMAPIPPRRLGIDLDGLKITRLFDGVGQKAGLLEGDLLVSIDGQEIGDRGALSRALQQGGAQKVALVQRGEQRLEIALDWSGSSDEAVREERRKLRADSLPAEAPQPERARGN